MARIELAPSIADDFDRILEHLARHRVEGATRVREIVTAIEILEGSPEIGRPAARGLRELVIGRGARGYVALYRYVVEMDTVFVLAIRSQREAGHK